MKARKFLLPVALLAFLFLSAGCSKDDETFEGTLKITFDSDMGSVSGIAVYSMQDASAPLHKITVKSGQTYTFPMLIGNYKIHDGQNGFFGFQVRKDHTTHLVYNKSTSDGWYIRE